MADTGQRNRFRVFQLSVIFFLLFLLVFILGTESVRVASEVGKETVHTESIAQTLTGCGYFFRDETLVTNRNNGPVRYLYANGSAVAAGDILAEVYRDDTGTDKRERAAALYDEIEVLEAALSESENTWQAEYLLAYAEMTDAASRGDLVAERSAAERLRIALYREEASGDAGTLLERIAELRADVAELVKYVGEPDAVYAGTNGVFYRQTDGYEGIFTGSAVSGLSPEGLRALLQTAPEKTDGNPEAVGKVVSDGGFALAVPAAAEEAVFFTAGTVYTVFLEGAGGVSMPMLLSEITYSADGSEALLCFTAEHLHTTGDMTRYCRVTVSGEQKTGLSVPETAMRVEDNRDGVYILSEGYALWCPVRILYRADGCCIVESAYTDPEVSDSAPVLKEGDAVIVTARRLYEGRALK